MIFVNTPRVFYQALENISYLRKYVKSKMVVFTG